MARLGAGAQCAGRPGAGPVRAPEPRPPLELRPRQLSVTTIEKWIANPYAIFAERILRPGAAAGCSAASPTRRCAARSCTTRSAASPTRFPAARCRTISAPSSSPWREAGLAELTGSPRVAAFWAPRFARFAAWFAETEPGRRIGVERRCSPRWRAASCSTGAAGPFTLTARADRIDVGKAGLVITDYKTGGNIKELASRARQGEAPQLPLEAAIAVGRRLHRACRRATVAALRYISSSGGEPPGQECTLQERRRGRRWRVAARQGLERLIAAFDDASTPYRALRRARFTLSLRRLRPPRPRRRVVGRDRRGGVARWASSRKSKLERARARRLEETQRNQAAAADPATSAWVSANAGTGKTHVLTMRVLRLLLAGTPPERILALTYTKAAAAEMSKRVFARLAEWVTAPDAELTGKLAELLDRPPTAEEMQRARQLFAIAIETPGGLKVQTIHAFCERLLQRFPLEAGVPPGFAILDDHERGRLLAEAADEMLAEATAAPATPLASALETCRRPTATDGNFDQLLAEALREQEWLAAAVRLDDGGDETLRRGREDLPQGHRARPGRAHATTSRRALAALLSDAELRRLRDILASGSANDVKAAERVAAVLRAGGRPVASTPCAACLPHRQRRAAQEPADARSGRRAP